MTQQTQPPPRPHAAPSSLPQTRTRPGNEQQTRPQLAVSSTTNYSDVNRITPGEEYLRSSSSPSQYSSHTQSSSTCTPHPVNVSYNEAVEKLTEKSVTEPLSKESNNVSYQAAPSASSPYAPGAGPSYGVSTLQNSTVYAQNNAMDASAEKGCTAISSNLPSNGHVMSDTTNLNVPCAVPVQQLTSSIYETCSAGYPTVFTGMDVSPANASLPKYAPPAYCNEAEQNYSSGVVPVQSHIETEAQASTYLYPSQSQQEQLTPNEPYMIPSSNQGQGSAGPTLGSIQHDKTVSVKSASSVNSSVHSQLSYHANPTSPNKDELKWDVDLLPQFALPPLIPPSGLFPLTSVGQTELAQINSILDSSRKNALGSYKHSINKIQGEYFRSITSAKTKQALNNFSGNINKLITGKENDKREDRKSDVRGKQLRYTRRACDSYYLARNSLADVMLEREVQALREWHVKENHDMRRVEEIEIQQLDSIQRKVLKTLTKKYDKKRNGFFKSKRKADDAAIPEIAQLKEKQMHDMLEQQYRQGARRSHLQQLHSDQLAWVSRHFVLLKQAQVGGTRTK
eukprot:CFRG6523T1